MFWAHNLRDKYQATHAKQVSRKHALLYKDNEIEQKESERIITTKKMKNLV